MVNFTIITILILYFMLLIYYLMQLRLRNDLKDINNNEEIDAFYATMMLYD